MPSRSAPQAHGSDAFMATLSTGQALRLSGSREVRQLRVLRGRLWVTITDEPGDHWLQPGESLTLPPGRRVVLEAWPQADFQLLQAVAHLARAPAACRAAKVGMAGGTRAPVVPVLGWLLQRFPTTP